LVASEGRSHEGTLENQGHQEGNVSLEILVCLTFKGSEESEHSGGWVVLGREFGGQIKILAYSCYPLDGKG